MPNANVPTVKVPNFEKNVNMPHDQEAGTLTVGNRHFEGRHVDVAPFCSVRPGRFPAHAARPYGTPTWHAHAARPSIITPEKTKKEQRMIMTG
jgi:hypothetical protein